MRRMKSRIHNVTLVVLIGLVIWVTFTVPVVAQGNGPDLSERLKDLTTWDDLCEVEDCDRFPDGFATWAIGTELYSLPLYETLSNEVGTVAYGLRKGRFFETNSDGDVTRSFGFVDKLRLSHCCGQLLEFFDLMKDFPALGDDPNVRWMPSSRVYLVSVDAYGSRHHVERYLERATIDLSQVRSVAEISLSDVPSFDENFWLLSVREIPFRNSVSANFTLLSKRPLLNGRHVTLVCNSLCDIRTVDFGAVEGPAVAHIAINWLRLGWGDSYVCGPEESEPGCILNDGLLDPVPQILATLEQLFAVMRTHP